MVTVKKCKVGFLMVKPNDRVKCTHWMLLLNEWAKE